jgi:hypothetical protein
VADKEQLKDLKLRKAAVRGSVSSKPKRSKQVDLTEEDKEEQPVTTDRSKKQKTQRMVQLSHLQLQELDRDCRFYLHRPQTPYHQQNWTDQLQNLDMTGNALQKRLSQRAISASLSIDMLEFCCSDLKFNLAAAYAPGSILPVGSSHSWSTEAMPPSLPKLGAIHYLAVCLMRASNCREGPAKTKPSEIDI